MNKKGETFASANHLTCQYYDCLEILLNKIRNTKDKKRIRQYVALTIFMAVAIIETFLNVYFRLLIESKKYQKHNKITLEELDGFLSLDKKLREWPKRFFEKSINYNKGIGNRVMELKRKRNELTHFKHTHEKINLAPKMSISGTSRVTLYHNLNISDANEAKEIIDEFIKEIFRLQGYNEFETKLALQQWTGIPRVTPEEISKHNKQIKSFIRVK